MDVKTNILQTLKNLEEKLRKDIRNNEYFGDSYICGVADKLNQIQEKFKNCVWFTEERYSFFETTEYDYPWGSGDNDNYANKCIHCGHTFRSHKRALSCKKCREESKNKWIH